MTTSEISHTEFNWKQDGETFYAQAWMPPNPTRLLFIIHGYGEHGGRYAELATRLCQRGFGVTAMDHFGHGKTTGERGFIPSYNAILNSIEQFMEETIKLFPIKQKFMWGHSMGGALALNYILNGRKDIAGLICGSPLLRMASSPPFIDIISARMMYKIYPSFIDKMNLERIAISHDHAILKAYVEDPLIQTNITTQTVLTISEVGVTALQNAPLLRIPCLLMHGTADKITSIEASKEFALKAPASYLTFKIWEGLYHELHNEIEPDRTAVFEYAMQWLEPILAQS